MRCSACGFESDQPTKFCAGCGARQGRQCGSCDAVLPLDARFCSSCGARLEAEEDIAPTIPLPRDPKAERRQLTVMFCDLVGSTSLSAELDPEDLHELVHAYQQACSGVIDRLQGHVAQHLGDGLLVYFGYPRAQEDDARRAVLAGLDILEAMVDLNRLLVAEGHAPLEVRIGLHTGPVVTGAVGGPSKQERLALGLTPNLAARIQGLAEPDTVFISEATRGLVKQHFEMESLGGRTLKGAAAPMEVHRVVRELSPGEGESWSDGATTTAWVGREKELGELESRLERSREGDGQVVLVRGEAGIGKTRLLQELRQRRPDPVDWVVIRGTQLSRTSAYRPVIEMLERLFGFERDATDEERLARLTEELDRRRPANDHALALLGNLLSITVGQESSLPELGPLRIREQTREVVSELLLGATDAPSVVLVEDLHWVDPSSLELVETLAERARGTATLLLLTSRTSVDWEEGALASATRIELERLRPGEVLQLVTALSAGRELSDRLRAVVTERTDGIPLFVEELTHMVLAPDEDSSQGGQRTPTVPSTLTDSLTARLDQLDGEAKRLIQLAAVVGRDFGRSLLAAITGLPESAIEATLRALVGRGLIEERSEGGAVSYTFRHALLCEVAHDSMLKRDRREQHGRTARVLIERFGDVAESQPELVASHYTEAAEAAPAVDYWQRAAQRAVAGAACVEAADHLRRGLELVPALPEDAGPLQHELAMQTLLGQAVSFGEGYGAVEAEQAYNRALEIYREMGDAPDRFWVLWGLAVFYQARGDLRRANELVQELLQIAEESGDPALQPEAHFAVAVSSYYGGDLDRAWDSLETGRQAMAELAEGGGVLPSGQASDVTFAQVKALVGSLGGRLDEAEPSEKEALERARGISHAFVLSTTLGAVAMIRQLLGDVPGARGHAEEALELASRHGFPYPEHWARALIGWCRIVGGEVEEGFAELDSSMDEMEKIGVGIGRTYLLGLRADACLEAGRLEEGRAATRQGQELASASGEGFWLAELRRLDAELALAGGAVAPEEAESALLEALETARDSGATLFELRAAMSLALLDPKKEGAGERLARACEGFSGRIGELDEARSLLQTLA
ncbi:MAG: adenylate/guanylate cyclase domain-containing protein [Acidobacteriota bacterium]